MYFRLLGVVRFLQNNYKTGKYNTTYNFFLQLVSCVLCQDISVTQRQVNVYVHQTQRETDVNNVSTLIGDMILDLDAR